MALWRIIPKGDLRLDAGKVVMLSGADYVRQKLSSRFRWWLGEWFLNLEEGIPYRRDVFVKDPDIDVIRALFRNVLRTVVEIANISRFDVAFDATTRLLTFDFEVSFVGGETLVVQPGDDDFILTIQEAA